MKRIWLSGAALVLALSVPTGHAARAAAQADDVSHRFPGFWEVAEEQQLSRIYGGIHFRFDQEAGQRVGGSIAEYVFASFMAPRGRVSD
jgi:hypothetical protein